MIIGITGRAGAGKDTVGKILTDFYPFLSMSFARPIKEMLTPLFAGSYALWNDREWKETVIEEIGYSPRQLAQTLGTEWGRETLDENFWIRIAMRDADMKQRRFSSLNVVFTDCRFENEATAIRARGGMIWHVIRPGDADGTKSEHSSEAGIAIEPQDFQLYNNGTLTDLRQTVREVYEAFQLRKNGNAAL